MTLQEFYTEYNLSANIKSIYDALFSTEAEQISTAEANRVALILKYRISLLMDCVCVSNNFQTIEKTINKELKRNILVYIEVERSIYKALKNANLQTTHNQTKFRPLNNNDDVNNLPAFSDETTYTDLSNYLAKIDYLKDNELLKHWNKVNTSIVWTY